MIDLKHVYKTYQGDRPVLRDLNLQVSAGEFVFLIGASGAGKTTLFKTISAFEKVSSGDLTVLGYNLAHLKPGQMPFFRRKIGFVFQNYKLLRNRTVRENIELPLVILNEPVKARQQRADELIEKLGLTGLSEQFPDFLSGGEQQRVAIARALIHKPSLIIADEPTGNLDPKLSEAIMNIFTDFSISGVTLIVATHDHRLIKKTSCRVLELERGSLIRDEIL